MILIGILIAFPFFYVPAVGGLFTFHAFALTAVLSWRSKNGTAGGYRIMAESLTSALIFCFLHAIELVSSYQVWSDTPKEPLSQMTSVYTYLLEPNLYVPYWIAYSLIPIVYFSGRSEPRRPVFASFGILPALGSTILTSLLFCIPLFNPSTLVKGVTKSSLNGPPLLILGFAAIIAIDLFSCTLVAGRDGLAFAEEQKRDLSDKQDNRNRNQYSLKSAAVRGAAVFNSRPRWWWILLIVVVLFQFIFLTLQFNAARMLSSG